MKLLVGLLLSVALCGQVVVVPAGTADPTLMAAQVPPGPCVIAATLPPWIDAYGPGGTPFEVLWWPYPQADDPRLGATWVLMFVSVSDSGPWDPIALWQLDTHYVYGTQVVPAWDPLGIPMRRSIDIMVNGVSLWFAQPPGLAYWLTSIWFVPDISGLYYVHEGPPTLVIT